jgi:transposase-like protein
MPKTTYKPEEIVAKLRQADVLVAQGGKIPDVVRTIGVIQVTYYRWRRVRRASTRSGEADEGVGARERPASQVRLGSDARQDDSGGGRQGKLLSPSRRRLCIDHVRTAMQVSERRACTVLGQHRSTQMKPPKGREDEEWLTADIVKLARQYGDTAIARSLSCALQAGSSTTNGLSGSGGVKG